MKQGLGTNELAVLKALIRRPGRCARRLAEELNTTSVLASRAVQELQKRKLIVQHKRVAGEGRKRVLDVTDAGREIAQSIDNEFQLIIVSVLPMQLASEYEEATKTLIRVSDHFGLIRSAIPV